MRFLCLHGHGTNSSILEAQLEPIRAYLPRNWEFEFLDGEMETEPAPGVDAIFPGPYFCYHGEPVPNDVQNAYDLVLEVVREEGPFDGVLGFSQGAAMASTLLLNHARTNPTEELFKMGVFISAMMPFDMASGKLKVTYDPAQRELFAIHQDAEGNATGDDHIDWMTDVRSKALIDEFEARRPMAASAKEATSVDVLLRFHPTTHTRRIRIPTVHVIGEKDQYADHGRALVGMCEPRLAHVVTHDGGHQLPRRTSTVAKVAGAIQTAVEQMQFQT
ncbi:hypothetical protein Aspvir_000020 [Aspergillus viridinutans]|uniref:Serine hydrolase domain-containing protein n=1 Tax=Aspergillus viridinutans TaxID=75553 RepID=A0A9P3BKJ3_ASPVI|nr:uncharacterized protein Aspvir_000020 [Aspergillus viridinutans]GIJ97914.1 hypothetical protein Aspvir_000020 [Aspergillus viridinutans]